MDLGVVIVIFESRYSTGFQRKADVFAIVK